MPILTAVILAALVYGGFGLMIVDTIRQGRAGARPMGAWRSTLGLLLVGAGMAGVGAAGLAAGESPREGVGFLVIGASMLGLVGLSVWGIQGAERAMRHDLWRLLERRFGRLPIELVIALDACHFEHLEALAPAARATETLEEFRARLAATA
jgi:hypothetical protein